MSFNRFHLALCLLAVTPFAHAADFVNGSFEADTNPNGPGTGVGVGPGGLTGWTVDSLSALITDDPSNPTPAHDSTTWHNTPAGDQYLYVNPNTSTESVSQSVALDAGPSGVNFLLADFASGFGTPGGAILVSVTRDSDSLSILAPTEFDVPDFSDFVRQSVGFTVPTTGSYTFTFQGVNGHAGNIDDVHVGPVPEPTTMAALGLGALGILRRRRA